MEGAQVEKWPCYSSFGTNEKSQVTMSPIWEVTDLALDLVQNWPQTHGLPFMSLLTNAYDKISQIYKMPP